MRIGNTPPTPPVPPSGPVPSPNLGNPMQNLQDALNRVNAAIEKLYQDYHSNPPASKATLDADQANINQLIDGDHGLADWVSWCSDPDVMNPPLSQDQVNKITSAISYVKSEVQSCVKAAEQNPPDVAAADAAYYAAGDGIEVISMTIGPHAAPPPPFFG